MELLYQTLYRLRRVHRFNGYIHVKAIPGADPELIERVGFLADRMSVNLELPTADGLARLAPGKTRDKILRPMRQIQTGIARQLEQEGRLESRGAWLPQKERGEIQIPGDGRYGIGGKAIGKGERECLQADKGILSPNQTETKMDWGRNGDKVKGFMRSKEPGGKWMKGLEGHIHRRSPVSSQDDRSMAVSDWEISQTARIISSPAVRAHSSLSGRLWRVIIRWLRSRKRCIGIWIKEGLYSAFIKVNEDSLLPDLPDGPPLLREHRLYQADWLMRYYGFRASELLSEKHPNFNVFLDPKCDWALQNLGEFPVEINRAPYETLLRVPGIGVKSAMRIVATRKQVALRFEDLKKMGVVLKRAVYFITCSGRMMYPVQIHEDAIAAQLISEEKRKQWQLSQSGLYRQMSLFDDFHMAQA